MKMKTQGDRCICRSNHLGVALFQEKSLLAERKNSHTLTRKTRRESDQGQAAGLKIAYLIP
jgi:hypothetical protein